MHIDASSAPSWANTEFQPDDDYARYSLELVNPNPFTLAPVGGEVKRIQNGAYPHGYLHNQNGKLQAGHAEGNWWSAQWMLVPGEAGYVRIQNRWVPSHYVHSSWSGR